MRAVLWRAGITGLAVAASLGAGRAQAPAALDQMVEAERAFARAAGERGVREAFVAFLADNAISVQPYGNAKAQWQARPAPPPGAKLAKLEWAPRTGDIADSGDLGWLTGNFTLTPPDGSQRYGCYFSIWERQANGEWRVRLDVGVDTPGPAKFPAEGFVRVAEGAGRIADERTRETPSTTLIEADRAVASDTSAKGIAPALLDRFAEEGRLHRHGLQPIVGKAAIARHFAATPPPALRFEPALDTGVASTGDLGWTLGRYAPSAGAGESGYYVRVWKRDAQKRWTIAVDVTQPAAP